MLAFNEYHCITKRFPDRVYEVLMHPSFPNHKIFEEDSICQTNADVTLNQQDIYLARKDEVPRHMRPVIELIKRVLIGLKTERKDFECLSELQRDVVQAYMRYILKPECITKIFDRDPGLDEYEYKEEDFLDLSKRKDETLKKVMSVALKVIYKEYLFENKINQSLNPRKYIKRKEINHQIFKKYFGREPEWVTRGKTSLQEHYLLFFIKEGVTEEWFESIIGIRQRTGKKPSSKDLNFLEKILRTLRSDKLMDVYRRKITSMAKKIFVMDRKFVHEGFTRFDLETAEAWYKLMQARLDIKNKKPKTALSIMQFSTAINVAIASLRRFVEKYEIVPDLDPKLFEKIEFTSRDSVDLGMDQDDGCGDSDQSGSD